MIVNNNPNSNDQDDLRDDDLDYETTAGSNYTNSGSDEGEDNDDVEEGDDIDADEEDQDSSDSITDTYPGEKQETKPDEIPEKHESEHEGSGYPHETEYQQPERSSDPSFSEQMDVTPPNPHEFPSVGNAETDFVSRPYRRRTARMIGYEPGTESI
jgi:hypothetical protein